MLNNKIRKANQTLALKFALSNWWELAQRGFKIGNDEVIVPVEELRSVVDRSVTMSNAFMARNKRMGFDALRALMLGFIASTLNDMDEDATREVDEELLVLQAILGSLSEMRSLDEVVNDTIDPEKKFQETLQHLMAHPEELQVSLAQPLSAIVDADFEEVG